MLANIQTAHKQALAFYIQDVSQFHVTASDKCYINISMISNSHRATGVRENGVSAEMCMCPCTHVSMTTQAQMYFQNDRAPPNIEQCMKVQHIFLVAGLDRNLQNWPQ
jgi:hypothetical protein